MIKVPESIVDTSHAALDLYSHQGGSDRFVGTASAAISVLSGIRGFQNLAVGGKEHKIEGIGNLALSAASGMVAYESFFAGHGHHGHHGHGFGLIGALECVHGLAEISVGAMEVKRPERRKIGLLRMAKGAAVLGSQVIPGAAAALQTFHLGSSCVLAAMDPLH